MPPLTCLCSGRILFMEPAGGRFHDDTVLGDSRGGYRAMIVMPYYRRRRSTGTSLRGHNT